MATWINVTVLPREEHNDFAWMRASNWASEFISIKGETGCFPLDHCDLFAQPGFAESSVVEG